MADVRARNKAGPIFVEFYYRGVRCREQTALDDSTENRRKVQALLNRIERDIRQAPRTRIVRCECESCVAESAPT